MTRTFRRLLALAFLLPILAASPAHAQLYNAGDPCPEPTAGRIFTQEGAAGPSLVCNGTILVVDESVLTGPYARGIGTATPKAPLHVAGEAIIGPTTGLACDADRTGGIRWSAADLTFEMCDGTAWRKVVATASGTSFTPPAGAGYFVMSNGTWDANLGGVSGANAKCLSNLTTNDWLGKSDAQARGMLTGAKVRAFICSTSACQNLIPLTQYVFAVSGNPAVGGGSFTTDASGRGPVDANNWSSADKFGGNYTYWTNRGVSGNNTYWDTVPDQTFGNGGCINFSVTATWNAAVGSSNNTTQNRWKNGLSSCNPLYNLICYVDPSGGGGADLTPDVFTFTALTNQVLNTVVTSDIVTVAGFDGPLSVYVTGPGSPQLRVNGGSWGNSVNISPGNTLQIRQTTSPAPSTSRAALVTLGTAAVDWVVTTAVGEVPVGNTGLTCDAGAAGTVRYNSGGTIMEYCNGTAWATIGGATPAGANREIQFNNAGGLGASSILSFTSGGVFTVDQGSASITQGYTGSSSALKVKWSDDTNSLDVLSLEAEDTSGYGDTNDFVGILYKLEGGNSSQVGSNAGRTGFFWSDAATRKSDYRVEVGSGNTLTEKMRLTSDGYLGVSTSAPKAPLHVAGEAIIGPTTGLACDADRKGGLRWSDAESTIEMCDGTDWKKIASATCDNAPAFFPFTAQTGLGVSTLVTSNIATITGMDAGCTATVSVSGVNGSPEYRVCSTSDCSSVTQNWTAANNIIDMQGKYLQLRATTSASAGTEFTITASVGPVSSDWSITTLHADCSLSPVGTVCADGTVYAGTSPDGNVPMYVTRCDYNMTWAGSTCINTRTGIAWNNGQADWVDTSLVNCGSAPACDVSGESNTTALAAADSDSDDAGVQPHAAAKYCDDLTVHGNSDWYLPSALELNVIYGNKAAIGQFNISGSNYWSSSESVTNNAWYQKFSDGAQGSSNKNGGFFVRCARR